jgi:hypothetical protein
MLEGIFRREPELLEESFVGSRHCRRESLAGSRGIVGGSLGIVGGSLWQGAGIVEGSL